MCFSKYARCHGVLICGRGNAASHVRRRVILWVEIQLLQPACAVCRRGRCFLLCCGGGWFCFMSREVETLKKAISTSPDVVLGHLTALSVPGCFPAKSLRRRWKEIQNSIWEENVPHWFVMLLRLNGTFIHYVRCFTNICQIWSFDRCYFCP